MMLQTVTVRLARKPFKLLKMVKAEWTMSMSQQVEAKAIPSRLLIWVVVLARPQLATQIFIMAWLPWLRREAETSVLM